MELNVVWFILLAVLFIGFFFLEGFDYGVGMLNRILGKNDFERRTILRTISPVWDGNEVWMITAGGALFAAFPHVYATMFSSFYMALFLMLVALIGRGVAFDFRDKHESAVWRNTWDWIIFFGSAIPAFLWGVAVTNLVQGLLINEKMIYVGTFFDLLTPYTLVGGLAFLLVFLFHGALFITLKVEGQLIERARALALKVGIVAALVYLVCVGLTYLNTDVFESSIATAGFLLAVLTFVAGYGCLAVKRYGLGFIMSSLAIAFTTIGFFAGLFPRLIVSTLNPELSLTIYNASSTPYTLKIMTFAAVIFVPIVLLYQGWTYWIFRKRISGDSLDH